MRVNAHALLLNLAKREGVARELQHLGAALQLMALHRGDLRRLWCVLRQASQHLRTGPGLSSPPIPTQQKPTPVTNSLHP